MSDHRLRVRNSNREELRKMKEDGETFSDVLLRILPEDPGPGDRIHDEEEYVSLAVNEEAYERTMEMAGEDVPVGRVIEFYLYKSKVEENTLAAWLLEELYDRGGI